MKNKIWIAAIMLGITVQLYAQEKKPLSISGYVEVYYQHDFNNPQQNSRPSFVYSHNRNNELNVNLGYIKAAYNTDYLRATLALAAGTYMNTNYAAEQSTLKNIYEASVGIKISKKHSLWIDAGLMPAHLGFESAIGKDNWTLTRSLAADNSPYFETGASLSYTTASGRWSVRGFVLNGWQRIQRVDGNSSPAFGHQLTYTPSESWSFNSSSFIGNDKADSVKQIRYFHNLYATYQATTKFGFIAGFDIGIEQQEKGSNAYNTWLTPTLIARYKPNKKIAIAARAEYYHDKKDVIVTTGTANGFQTYGFSMNMDYYVLPAVVWRTEFRALSHTKDAIFVDRHNSFKKNSVTATTAIAVNF